MATLHSATTCNQPKVDEKGLQEFLESEEYYIYTDEVMVEDGVFKIYGYGTPTAEMPEKDVHNEDVFIDFLQDVAEYLEEELKVQVAGYVKCRYPLVGYQYRVTTDGKVFRNTLDSEEEVIRE